MEDNTALEQAKALKYMCCHTMSCYKCDFKIERGRGKNVDCAINAPFQWELPEDKNKKG